MEIKPLYSLAEIAQLERCAPGTLRNRIMRESKLPAAERRYPGYQRGFIPLADVKTRFGLTTAELAEFATEPEPVTRTG